MIMKYEKNPLESQTLIFTTPREISDDALALCNDRFGRTDLIESACKIKKRMRRIHPTHATTTTATALAIIINR